MQSERGHRGLASERGQSIVFVAVGLAAMLAFGALAVDMGMLLTARAEAQRIADAAALAGASAYLDYPSPYDAVTDVTQRANSFATMNDIRRMYVGTPEVTVLPMPDLYRVRVTIHRPFVGPVFFARIFGISYLPIKALATAEAAPAGINACLKPFAIPDEGYTTEDLGKLDTLKVGDEDYSGVDSFFFPWVIPWDSTMPQTCPQAGPEWGGFHPGGATNGGNCPFGASPPGGGSCWYRTNICNQNCQEVNLGQEYPVAKGNMEGPTAQGINVLLAQDPNVAWDPIAKQVERDGVPIDFGDTPRVIKVALYDPATYTRPDQYTIRFSSFAYWFLENGPYGGYYDPNRPDPIVGRFLFYAPGSGGGVATGPFSRYLRLVE